MLQRTVVPGRTGQDILLVSVGTMAPACLDAAALLTADGFATTVVDPRWVKPVDPALAKLAAGHRLVVTVEDNGRAGGVGAAIAQALRDAEVDTRCATSGCPRSSSRTPPAARSWKRPV